MRSSACRRHSASCARRLRAAAAHETAGQRQRQCFAHGTLSTARSSLCIIPGRRLHCDRSRAHLKNIWKAFPRSIHDPDYNNTTYQQHNHAATAQTCASNTDTCRSASQRHRARLLRSYCCQVRSGGCIAVQTPKHGLRRPPLLSTGTQAHTRRGTGIDRMSARGRALAAARRILPRSLLLAQKEASAAAGWPPPCPHLPWVHVRLVSERRVPQGDGRWAKGRSKRWHGAGGVQEQAEP